MISRTLTWKTSFPFVAGNSILHLSQKAEKQLWQVICVCVGGGGAALVPGEYHYPTTFHPIVSVHLWKKPFLSHLATVQQPQQYSRLMKSESVEWESGDWYVQAWVPLFSVIMSFLTISFFKSYLLIWKAELHSNISSLLMCTLGSNRWWPK